MVNRKIPSIVIRYGELMLAYAIALRILAGYLGFALAGQLFGKAWREKQLPGYYKRTGIRVKRAILRLNGLFVKMGQLISIMSNFLPPEFRDELEDLQDRIPARPVDEIRQRIKAEFGHAPESLFRHFDPAPLASASLAQVHRAETKDGKQVAVKVQHLNIERTARMDLAAIGRILKIYGRLFRVQGLDRNFDQVKAMVLEELDFSQEARNIETIAQNFDNNDSADQEIVFPRVIGELCSPKVLTTEYIEGVKVTDLERLAEIGVEPKDLAGRIMQAYCEMIFEHGVYHADPHPGNLLALPNGKLALLDFGAVAELSAEMKEGIPRFFDAILRRDSALLTAALQQMGFVVAGEREADIQHLIEAFQDRFLSALAEEGWSLSDISHNTGAQFEMWREMRRLDISYADLSEIFQVPRDWFLLERTLLLLIGVCHQLDPDMNPMVTIRPYLAELVKLDQKDWPELARGFVMELVKYVATVPRDLQRFLARANSGNLEVKVRGLPERTRVFYALGQQAIFTLLALGSGAIAYLAHRVDDQTLAHYTGYASLFFLGCTAAALWSGRRSLRHLRVAVR